MSSKKTKVAISFGIVAVLLAWLVVSGFNENMQYFVTVTDFHKMPASEQEQSLRVKGNLVPASVEETGNNLEMFFLLEEGGEQLRVRFDKERPDTFVDGSEVVVEGKLTDKGYFAANTLMAKCPSKYESSDDYDVNAYDPTTHEIRGGTN